MTCLYLNLAIVVNINPKMRLKLIFCVKIARFSDKISLLINRKYVKSYA